MRNKFTRAFIVLALLTVYVTIAHSAQEQQSVSEQARTAQDLASCDFGGASEQFSCFKEQLIAEELHMHAMLEKAIAEYESMWGEKAIEEGRTRLRDAQSSWKSYRDAHCHFGYYTESPAHPASVSLEIVTCQLDKTKQRVEEIQRMYLK